MPEKHSERRGYPRKSVDCVVHLCTKTEHPDERDRFEYNCTAQDISLGGMKVLAGCHYPAGTQVHLSFECEKDGMSRVNVCMATVVWAAEAPIEDQWWLGLRFEDKTGAGALMEEALAACPECQKAYSPESRD